MTLYKMSMNDVLGVINSDVSYAQLRKHSAHHQTAQHKTSEN